MARIAATPEEASFIAGLLEELLQAGCLVLAQERLAEFIETIYDPESPYEGYENLAELPICHTPMDPDTRARFEKLGLDTVGKIRDYSLEQMTELPGINSKRAQKALTAIDQATRDFLNWKATGKRPRQNRPGDPLSQEERQFAIRCITRKIADNERLISRIRTSRKTEWIAREQALADAIAVKLDATT